MRTTDKVFVWWSIVAVALTYLGIIVGGYSNNKRWKRIARVGQVIGVIGLFAILFYLGIK